MTSILQAEFKKFGIPDLNIDQILYAAGCRDGVFGELFFEETASTRISWETGKVDRIIEGTDRGVGLRLIRDQRSIYGYTTDLSYEAILSLAKSLATGQTAQQPARIDWRTPRRPDEIILSYLVKRSPRKVTLEDKIDVLKRMDQAARKRLPGLRQMSGVYLDSLRKILVLNSDGLVSSDEKTYLQAVATVVGEKEGRVETAHATDGGFVGMEFFDSVSPESIAEEAAARVALLLNAKPAPAGAMPVILAGEAGGTMVHEAVGHGLEADLSCNGLSVYGGKLGQQVASPLITVIDDGTQPARRGSYRYDDEGNPSQKNVLIENGILKSYMVDRLCAMKFDLMATGNGRRESFRHKPIVRMTNTYIAPGKDDPEEILRQTSWGLFVKAMGGGQVNTVTGDFVFAVTEGYLIRDGKIAEPVRGATLVGNGPRVLQTVDRVGSDLGYSTGTCGKDGQGAPVTDAQPTLRVPELTVGGEVPQSTYWKR